MEVDVKSNNKTGETQDVFSISYKSIFGSRKTRFFVCECPIMLNLSKDDQNYLIEKMSMYGIKLEKVTLNQEIFIKGDQESYANLSLVEVESESNNRAGVLEVIDIHIDKSHRNKKIGTKLLEKITEIAKRKGCKYVVGELQAERDGEPLGRRKNFFTKNSFHLWQSEKSKLSGWVVKKKVS